MNTLNKNIKIPVFIFDSRYNFEYPNKIYYKVSQNIIEYYIFFKNNIHKSSNISLNIILENNKCDIIMGSPILYISIKQKITCKPNRKSNGLGKILYPKSIKCISVIRERKI